MSAIRERLDVRRIILSVALICFTLGLVVAAATVVDDSPRSTYAGLFSSPVVDLDIRSERGVDAFVGSPNLAPGDVSRGTLRLYSDPATPRSIFDLDFDARHSVEGRAARYDHRDVLFLKTLIYDGDDLLSTLDGGRDLIREIDAHPILGNADGRISLRELEAGVNDLPAPRPPGEGGTSFVFAVVFNPPREAQSSDFTGARLRLQLVFLLADTTDADLN